MKEKRWTKDQSYQRYKASKADWVSGIPEHWDTQRIKNSLLVHISGVWGEEPDGENDLACIRVADFDRQHWRVRSHIPTIRAVTPSEREGKIIQPGDLLLEKSGGGEKQPVGTVVLYDCEQEATCSNFIQRLVVRDNFNPRYANFVHSTLYAQGINRRSIKQTTGIQNIDIYGYLSESVPVPPLEEQAAIVRFLDHADEQIQRYIAGKERLIALLEEERQALVHQAVTRGLDPDVKLKRSGVEWLEEIPEHWEGARFGQNVNIAEGQVDPKVEPYASMLMIAPNHVESGTGQLLGRETAYEQGAISGKYLCRVGDVVYSKIRPGLAKVTVAPSDCLCSADMYPLRPRDSLQSNFLFWLLLSTGFTAWSILESGRVAMPKINRRTLNNVHIPLPPLAEQASIVQHLVEATPKVSKAISHARRQIDLMNEYRTRLIADVVTGQVDVREAADKLTEPVAKH